MENGSIPTLFDWIGGKAALTALMAAFYDRVRQDSVLAPVFATMGPEHPAHLAAFIGEVFGGPKTYSETFGGHAGMIRHHLHRSLTEAQRRRWIGLLLDACEDLGVPGDPEFMSALVGYLEWGSRLAVINSQPGTPEPGESPMPRWGLGEVGGPYRQKGET